MIHLGDITKINGHDVPTVDVITGGSPCQDLSVAGKRAGLAGERSGLFMEQMRIIKEMRDESAKELHSRGTDFTVRDIQPRFMVWENVPGAFSSNKGEDFRCVLEETARIADKNAIIPRLEGGGRWSPSGCIMADGWSIAWRVHDAQFWGVPQRRKRISVVADFGSQSAPEILFERKSMSGDYKQSRTQRQEDAGDNGKSIEKPIIIEPRSQDGVFRIYFSIMPTLNTAQGGQRQPCVIQDEHIRRITPLECERLQGYPDEWTNIGEWTDTKGKKHKDADSPRYKALGNSIALPFWDWMAGRICRQYDRPIKMASLFDGIGGFPLVFSRHGADPVWASEIEEFPIAVTKIRFPEKI